MVVSASRESSSLVKRVTAPAFWITIQVTVKMMVKVNKNLKYIANRIHVSVNDYLLDDVSLHTTGFAFMHSLVIQ